MASRKKQKEAQRLEAERDKVDLQERLDSRRSFIKKLAFFGAGAAAIGGGYLATRPLPPEEQYNYDIAFVSTLEGLSFVNFAVNQETVSGEESLQKLYPLTPTEVDPTLRGLIEQVASAELHKRKWPQESYWRREWKQAYGLPLEVTAAKELKNHAESLTEHYSNLIGKNLNDFPWKIVNATGNHDHESDWNSCFIVQGYGNRLYVQIKSKTDPSRQFTVPVDDDTLISSRSSSWVHPQDESKNAIIVSAGPSALWSPISELSAPVYAPRAILEYGKRGKETQPVVEAITEAQAYGSASSFFQKHYPRKQADTLVRLMNHYYEGIANKYPQYVHVRAAHNWMRQFSDIGDSVTEAHSLFMNSGEKYMSTIAGSNWRDSIQG